MPFEVTLLEVGERPVYQRIAGEAAHLRRLGMNNARIALRLGVDPKSVEKAICWLDRQG